MEELISLAQGDGGPVAADSNDGFGLFYLGGEKRMLAMNSKVGMKEGVQWCIQVYRTTAIDKNKNTNPGWVSCLGDVFFNAVATLLINSL